MYNTTTDMYNTTTGSSRKTAVKCVVFVQSKLTIRSVNNLTAALIDLCVQINILTPVADDRVCVRYNLMMWHITHTHTAAAAAASG